MFYISTIFLEKNIIDIPRVVKALDKQRSHNYMFFIKVTISIALVAYIAMLTTQLYMFLPAYHKIYIVSNLLLIGSIVSAISCLVGGFISDYVSKTKMMSLLIILNIALTPFFYKSIIAGENAYSYFILLSTNIWFFYLNIQCNY